MFFKYPPKFYLFWFWVICRRISNLVYSSVVKLIYGPEPQGPTDQEKIKDYHEKQKKKFATCYRPSSNIEPVFYDREQYNDLSWKEMEKIKDKWRQRVLIEPLPIHPSSIIMFYNPDKFAFSYYSDIVISSYDMLNAVAMKYSTVFFCQDFFVDEVIYKETSVLNVLIESSLLKILREEFMFDPNQKPTEKTETEEKPNEALQIIQENNTLFKKLKVNVKPSSNRTTREIKQEENKSTDNLQCKNRFIYLGRVRDFNPIKKQLTLKNVGKITMFPEMTEHAEPTETDKSVFMGSSMGWKNFKEKKLREKKQVIQEDNILL